MRLSLGQLRTALKIAAVACLGLCAESGAAAPRDSTRMKTALVVGDSLSDGFRLPRTQAYPALLATRLRKEGLNFEVMNASASGGTTASGLARLAPHLRRKIDIFLLQLGINDAFRGVPIPDIRANLQAMIDQAKKNHPNCAIVIVGMQLPVLTPDGYVRAFGEMYRELADKNNAALVPYLLEGVGGDPALNLPDRIHPNAAGQKILAENVWRVLEPIAQAVSKR